MEALYSDARLVQEQRTGWLSGPMSNLILGFALVWAELNVNK